MSLTSFEKWEWVLDNLEGDGLTSLGQYLQRTVEESWLEAVSFDCPGVYQYLVDEIKKNHTIYPPPEDVFAWTRYCNPEDVKVVIIGQDPYPNEGQAHGLSFSIKHPSKLSPALDTIFEALTKDGFQVPRTGNLTAWATQGVLLLNTILTVGRDDKMGAGNIVSHKGKGWEAITDAVIHHLCNKYPGLVFMLWGEKAKEKTEIIQKYKDFDRKPIHYISDSPHPSWVSDHEEFHRKKHFHNANIELRKQDKAEIDWSAFVPPIYGPVSENQFIKELERAQENPEEYFYLSQHDHTSDHWTDWTQPIDQNRFKYKRIYYTAFTLPLAFSKFWYRIPTLVQLNKCLNRPDWVPEFRQFFIVTIVEYKDPLNIQIPANTFLIPKLPLPAPAYYPPPYPFPANFGYAYRP